MVAAPVATSMLFSPIATVMMMVVPPLALVLLLLLLLLLMLRPAALGVAGGEVCRGAGVPGRCCGSGRGSIDPCKVLPAIPPLHVMLESRAALARPEA